MANSFRKTTLKISFSNEYIRPKALEVEQFLRDHVKIPSTDVIGIHLSIVSSVVYVKLKNEAACNEILERTKDGLKFRHSDGNIGPVTVDHAGLRTIRIFELPFELPPEEVIAALRPYGTVHSHVFEKWTQLTTYPVLNGVRQVRIELDKHIPSYLTIAGCRAIVIYDGQPKTCSGCGKEGHIRSECQPMQRRIVQLPPTDPVQSTTSTTLPITYTAAIRTIPGQINRTEQPQDIPQDATSGRGEVEQLSSKTVSAPIPPTHEKDEETDNSKMELDNTADPTAALVPEQQDSLPSSDTESHIRKQRSPKKNKKRKKSSSDENVTESQDDEKSFHHTEPACNPITTDCDMSHTEAYTDTRTPGGQPMIVEQSNEPNLVSRDAPPQTQGTASEEQNTRPIAWADDIELEFSAAGAAQAAASASNDRQNV